MEDEFSSNIGDYSYEKYNHQQKNVPASDRVFDADTVIFDGFFNRLGTAASSFGNVF
jgi:hypothetical protein